MSALWSSIIRYITLCRFCSHFVYYVRFEASIFIGRLVFDRTIATDEFRLRRLYFPLYKVYFMVWKQRFVEIIDS